jgi:hypothetical protein
MIGYEVGAYSFTWSSGENDTTVWEYFEPSTLRWDGISYGSWKERVMKIHLPTSLV